MKWRAESEALSPRIYEIKHDPEAGFYLYVFENGECVRDHLQDTLNITIDTALEHYGVPRDIWTMLQE